MKSTGSDTRLARAALHTACPAMECYTFNNMLPFAKLSYIAACFSWLSSQKVVDHWGLKRFFHFKKKGAMNNIILIISNLANLLRSLTW